jgi:hypothetical protein
MVLPHYKALGRPRLGPVIVRGLHTSQSYICMYYYYITSTDGLIGKEAKTFLKKLSSLLAEKWEKPYSVVCGYVNAQVSIAIVRATHRCLRGSRIPTSQMSHCRPHVVYLGKDIVSSSIIKTGKWSECNRLTTLWQYGGDGVN